jgi:hypothetical protein
MPFLLNAAGRQQWCGVFAVLAALGLTACGGGSGEGAAEADTGTGTVVALEVPSIESTVAGLPTDSELQQTPQSL